MLQKEAEAACPLPSSLQPNNQTASQQTSSETILPIGATVKPQPILIPQTTTQPIGTLDVWEKINFNLERIAVKLETVDLTIKKKRVKRFSK
jgi:hypothetical protein